MLRDFGDSALEVLEYLAAMYLCANLLRICSYTEKQLNIAIIATLLVLSKVILPLKKETSSRSRHLSAFMFDLIMLDLQPENLLIYRVQQNICSIDPCLATFPPGWA